MDVSHSDRHLSGDLAPVRRERSGHASASYALACGLSLLGMAVRRGPDGWARAFGLSSLMACSAIVALYLGDYARPAHHPLAPSLRAIVRRPWSFSAYLYIQAFLVTGRLPR